MRWLDHLIARTNASRRFPPATLDAIQLGETTMEKAIASGDASISGDPGALKQFLSLLDDFPFWFNIVTP